jgi:hypothetical protein
MKQFLLLLFLVPQPVWAEWIELGAPDGLTHYIDHETVRRTESGRRAWFLYNFKTARELSPKKTYSSSTLLMEFDCSGERYRGLQWTAYSGNMGRGNVVSAGSDVSGWEVVTPNTIAVKQLLAACAVSLPK